MPVKKIMEDIADHIKKSVRLIDEREVDDFVKSILSAKRVFVFGAGRSGLVTKAFAMRLSQIGLSTYVVGETITPGMKKGDLFVIVSGSGETTSAVSAAKVAKQIGVKVYAVTSYPTSSLGKIVESCVKITGKTKVDIEKDHLKHQIEGRHSSLTPLGTLFDDTAMVFLDGVVGRLMNELSCGEESMSRRHADDI